MATQRGDTTASVGGTPTDVPSTFEQSSLNGTTSSGNARLIVRDATQIDVIDTNNYWSAETVEGVLDQIGQVTLAPNSWGNIIGTLSNQTDLQAALDAKLDNTTDTFTGDLTITGDVDAATVNADAGSVFRKNALINGMMNIWQRGTSYAPIADGSVVYTVDRFAYYQDSSTGVANVSRSTNVPTYAEAGVRLNYSWEWDVTTADATLTANEEASITYNMEGFDYAQLSGGDATFSFWIYATKTGTYSVGFRNAGLNRSYVTEYTVAASNIWQKVSITIPLTEVGGTWDYTNGNGLQVVFNFAMSGSHSNGVTSTLDSWETSGAYCSSNQVNAYDTISNVITLAGFQAERGSAATSLETRHYAEEISLCQRYFQRLNSPHMTGICATTTTNVDRVGTALPVRMRAAPSTVVNGTPTFYDGSAVVNYSSISTAFPTVDSVQYDFLVATALTLFRPVSVVQGSWSLDLSSEL